MRNQHLIEKARAFRPDWLWLTGDNTVITASTLAQIKAETGCKLIDADPDFTDCVFYSSSVMLRVCMILYWWNHYYHGIQWLEMGARRMDCMPIVACDPDFHHPYTLTDDQRKAFACDIAFVGTLIPDNLYSQRIQALEVLHDFDLGVWSVHELPTSLRPYGRGGALGKDMLEVLSAAKMTINTHGDFMRYGGNMRLFEAAAVGVFQIADHLPGIQQWFTEGETIVTYKNIDELRSKVRYYLDHDGEREAIVQRGRYHVYAHHTYDQRVQRLEELVNAN